MPLSGTTKPEIKKNFRLPSFRSVMIIIGFFNFFMFLLFAANSNLRFCFMVNGIIFRFLLKKIIQQMYKINRHKCTRGVNNL